VKYLLWQGVRCHQVLGLSLDSGTSPTSSPMLAVSGLSADTLASLVASVNKRSPSGAADIQVSLVNSWSASVVSGHPDVLAALVKAVAGASASPDESQARTPFSDRASPPLPLLLTAGGRHFSPPPSPRPPC
jgi:malonyl CoA-acyl carrier protein transacylase